MASPIMYPLYQQWSSSSHSTDDDAGSISSSYSPPSCHSRADDNNNDDDNSTDGGDPGLMRANIPPVNKSSRADWGSMHRTPSLNMPRALSVAVEKEVFGDGTTEKSMLAEPHIRLLLLTYGLYWVRQRQPVGSWDKRGNGLKGGEERTRRSTHGLSEYHASGLSRGNTTLPRTDDSRIASLSILSHMMFASAAILANTFTTAGDRSSCLDMMTAPTIPPAVAPASSVSLKLSISGLGNLFALWAMSTVPKGGLDWSTKEIGQVGVRRPLHPHACTKRNSASLCVPAFILHGCSFVVFVCPLTTVLPISPSLQVLLTSGIMVFVFELLALPVLLKRVGISSCQRAGGAILVIAFLLLPQLSSLQGTGYSLTAASLAILFAIYTSCDCVSVE